MEKIEDKDNVLGQCGQIDLDEVKSDVLFIF